MEPHHNIASLIVKYIQTFRELKSLFTDSKILRIFELTVGGFLHLKILLNYGGFPNVLKSRGGTHNIIICILDRIQLGIHLELIIV